MRFQDDFKDCISEEVYVYFDDGRRASTEVRVLVRVSSSSISLRCIPLFLLMSVAAARAQSYVPGWTRDAIFYQIFPERFANGDHTNDPPGVETWGGEPKRDNYFGGDLQGIIDHLDYIASLGVNALYLNPIFESTSNHKYHTKDYLKIDPHFGDDTTFKRLVDGCHTRGIRIILDGVFNHTGVDFFAFESIRKLGAESPYLGWYNVYSLPINPPSRPNYECWWGYGTLPKLMTTNPDVQQYLFEVTRHWMSFGIDGWRLDVPNEIPHQFWIDWRALVKSKNPDAYIVGEIWGDATPWLKGDQFDAVMNYRFRDDCIRFFIDGTSTARQFDSSLAAQRSDYPPEVNYALQNLLGSHDTERLMTLCKGDVRKIQLAVLFQMTYLGAPMVYYGDEVGMTGGKDPGSRGTMVWDPAKQDKSLLRFYHAAIALRKAHPALRRGTITTLRADADRGIYIFDRTTPEEKIRVALNPGRRSKRVTWPLATDDGSYKWTTTWPSVDRPGTPSTAKGGLTLRPMDAVVWTGIPLKQNSSTR